MTRPVVLTGDVFRMQTRGGITRVVIEIATRLRRPVVVPAGLHVSAELAALGPRARWAVRIPSVPALRRLATPVNALVDAFALRGARGAILHPTYYRDPRALPRSAPVVVTVYDMIHERFPELLPTRRRWWSRTDAASHKRALCARADRILCISRATRDDLVGMFGVPETRTRVTPLAGRDWTTIAPEPIPDMTTPFVMWIGERHGYKNFTRTCEAWATCPAAADTVLLLVGGGPLRVEERALLARHGAGARVRRLDPGDGALRWAYEHATVLLYTALWEGFGLPVLEALALGCPVVASDVAPLREVGGDQVVYADPTRVDAIAAAIAVALGSDRSAASVARRAAHAARSSWDACAAATEAVYAELD
ncbi:MAG: glycosyltransferase family 4 protein [Candidatus Eisenbacteria bacterium]